MYTAAPPHHLRRSVAPTNLPAQVTTFVGRRADLDTLVAALGGSPPTTRLLTLTGTGGVGKTRLAQEVAARLLDAARFPDGVWLVELAPLVHPQRLTQAVASVLGLQEAPGQPFAELLLDTLRPRQLLLILDNCEHLIQACAELVHALLRACPGIVVLATSREALNIPGETARRVPSLARPDPLAPPDTIDELCAFDAVRLFTARATAVSADFCVNDHNAPAVARVCTQLDGIPLALELAAARVRALSVEQIAARLDDCFPLLGGGSRTAPPRQQTLEAAVTWSYDLLHPRERHILTRLAVFVGPWTLEAAEAVCADSSPGDPVFDVLARLVEKSLVLTEEDPTGTRRYRLLETIRQFALQRLHAEGPAAPDAVRERHFRWYLRFALDSEQILRFEPVPWTTRSAWITRLRWEVPNLRAAWQWALHGPGDLRGGLRLAAALFPFFWTGYLVEGRECLVDLLDRDRGSPPSAERAWALAAVAKLTVQAGGYRAAAPYCAEYLALPRELQFPVADGFIRNALGLIALHRGDTVTARAEITAGLAAARAGGDTQAVPLYLLYLAAVAVAEDRPDEAAAIYRDVIDRAIAVDFPPATGLALGGLAQLAHATGQRPEARALYEEALTTLRDMAAMPQIAELLAAYGQLELASGDPERAAAHLAESLQLATLTGHREAQVAALEGTAVLLLADGAGSAAHAPAVLRLIGAAAALRQREPRLAPTGPLMPALAAAERRAAGLLGPTAAARLVAEGRAAPPSATAADARAALSLVPGSSSPRPATDGPQLTRREREVIELLARGASNRDIATALVIAERTAEMHVSNVLAKLGLTSRAQVAVWATRSAVIPPPRA